MTKLFSYFLSILTAVILSCCTFTKTKTIYPAFTLTLDSISRDINSIIVTPEATITGKEITTNGQIKTELTINLINSKKLPDDANEQKIIAGNIAILIKNTLYDPDSFTDYKVLFTKKVDGGAGAKSAHVGYLYKSNDLKNYIQIVSVGDQFDSSINVADGKNVISQNEPEIVSVFSYYNNVPGSPVKFNMYKETDSNMLLVFSRDLGQILPGNHYMLNKLSTADFYKIKGLGSGNYKVEYLVSDTVAGSKNFALQ